MSPQDNIGDPGHVPVLPEQVLALLDPKPGQVLLDCTVGRAGHALLLAPRLAPGGRWVGLDVDQGHVEHARQRLAGAPVRVDLVKSNFAQARRVLTQLGLERVDLLLADLGFSSSQMDDASRGFSFRRDGPLDMRMDRDLPQTAADLVNRLSELELADVILRLGQEPLARRIARNIAARRAEAPIKSTAELADVVRRAYGARATHSRMDPATRTFMALRLAVNLELEALEQLLASVPVVLGPGGVAAVISFHSLEDRLVKQAFSRWEAAGQGLRLTRKPIVADEAEVARNPRSRSAKLRAVRWIGAAAPGQST